MIVFDLQCSNGHTFEGWFEDGEAYEEQKEKSLIACPACNDTSVFKLPSAFAIKSSPVKEETSGHEKNMAEISKKLSEFVDKNFDDVGCDFAKEALKIHYGASEPRNIKGTSTKEEEKTLKEEGIEFFKIPLPQSSDTDA
ncbi:DUF1178 family protein [Desulfococcaceae bacterium HSG8]|nr:DUF1178 family protein [Desulfococcaceae bacterium HSG8]